MKQKENKKSSYVSPVTEFISMEQDSPLMFFSGDHNGVGDDDDPLHARRNDFFDMEEEDEESSSERDF